MDMFGVVALTMATASAGFFCSSALSLWRGSTPSRPTQLALALSLTSSLAVSGVGAMARAHAGGDDVEVVEKAAPVADSADKADSAEDQGLSAEAKGALAINTATAVEPYSGPLRGVERYLAGRGARKSRRRRARRRSRRARR